MKLKYAFENVEMGDEIISVPVGDDAYQIHGVVKLNQSGMEIMDMLKQNVTVEAMVDKLSSKYDNEIEDLHNYVLNVIKVLREAGLIEG